MHTCSLIVTNVLMNMQYSYSLIGILQLVLKRGLRLCIEKPLEKIEIL